MKDEQSLKYKNSRLILNEHEWRNTNAIVLKQIKSTLNQNGFWPGDYEQWNEIVAVCNLETMITFGVDVDEEWQVKTDDNFSLNLSLKKVISFLRSRIVKSGNSFSFGEDYWDLFRLVLVIKKLGLENEFPEYKQLEKFCLSLCEDDAFLGFKGNWSGPAIIALGIELCVLLSKTKQKDILTQKLMSMRNNDGSWGDSSNSGLCIWHTSQVLNVVSMSREEEQRTINCIIRHLKSDSFLNEYFLKDYYTAYALLSMYNNGFADNDIFYARIKDIKMRLDAGQIRDRGALSMIGTMLSRMFTDSGKIVDVLIREEELNKYIEENKKLNNEIISLKKKYEKYLSGGVYISEKTVKVLKWLFGIIFSAIITTIITIIITNVIS